MKHAKHWAALVALLALGACGVSVNDDLLIPDGAEQDGSQNTVNGSIRVGTQARVNGSLRTVNGRINVEAGARVGEVNTVNGRVEVDADASVAGVRVINGSARIGEGVEIDRGVTIINGDLLMGSPAGRGGSIGDDVSCRNGRISLRGVRVGGDVSTETGDIDLYDGTHVRGDIRVERDKQANSDADDDRRPRVVIGAGVVVDGGVVFEREGVLWVHEDATVNGPVEGVERSSFSGDAPPAP